MENLIGMTNALEEAVTEKNSALALKSGSLKVFATPAMIRLIEEAAEIFFCKNSEVFEWKI